MSAADLGKRMGVSASVVLRLEKSEQRKTISLSSLERAARAMGCVRPVTADTEVDGSTPLDPDEAKGLIPSGIATRADLDALEQANIARAQQWALQRPRPAALTESFARGLHKRMFGEVWRWAGTYRTSDKNLGVARQQVPVQVGELMKNTVHQLKQQAFGWDELGVRFHHRLVVIHPFANGNGRHARLLTDVVMGSHAQPAALRAADGGDLKPLLAFVRS